VSDRPLEVPPPVVTTGPLTNYRLDRVQEVLDGTQGVIANAIYKNSRPEQTYAQSVTVARRVLSDIRAALDGPSE